MYMGNFLELNKLIIAKTKIYRKQYPVRRVLFC